MPCFYHIRNPFYFSGNTRCGLGEAYAQAPLECRPLVSELPGLAHDLATHLQGAVWRPWLMLRKRT